MAGDFQLLCRFFFENNADVREYSSWCIGRFVDWQYALWGAKQTTPGFWSQNAQLWFDGFGDLAGFAISEEGGLDFAIITTAGFRFLFDDILDWALANWGARGPALSIEVTSHQRLEMECLEANGFRRTASFNRSRFDLQSEKHARFCLDEGYSIVAMSSPADYLNQALLRHNAFVSEREITEDELANRLKITRHAITNPIYHARTDLCLMAPDGTFVSGCEALIDTRNLEADIERVCTHSDYRRRGYARAVIKECLVRLTDMGLKTAYITGYSDAAIRLYSSLGASAHTQYHVYQQSA